MPNTFRFIDLFAGIGGIKLAFEREGFVPVFSNDVDPYCKTTFDLNFAKFFEATTGLYIKDVALIPSPDLPDCDVLTGGFPCQPFSIAGYRKGFTDKGRGDLFFEIVRILKDKQPQAFLLENVKNLKTHNNGSTLQIIYDELEQAGYHVTDAVLNTMEYGNLPQNRERIYIVGFLEQDTFDRFSFPEKIPLTNDIHSCFQQDVADKYYYEGKPLYDKIKDEIVRRDTVYQWRRKYVRENKSNVCPTLTANMGTGGHNVPIILDDRGIRKLTPRECANLQGFPPSYQFPPNMADSRLYKQIGNSVSIPVVQRIAKNMYIALTHK